MLNTVKLGDVVSYEKVNGQGSNRPYVGMENISSETMEVVGSPEIPEKTSSTFKFDERHVLFGRLRPYLRKVLVPNFDGQCSTEIFCLLPSDKVDKKFLAHWLLHPKVSTRINETSTGARMPRANMNAILGFDFPLPPLAEQQRIVAKLDAAFAEIDGAIETAEKNVENIAYIFSQTLDGLVNANDLGKEILLGEVCKLSQGLAINKSTKHLLVDKSTQPLLRIKDLISNKVEQYVDDSYHNEKTRVNKEDIIFTRTGSLGLVFRGMEGVLHNNSFKVEPEVSLSSDYLFWWLKHRTFLEKIHSIASKAAQPDISHKLFSAQSIRLPTLKKQTEIVSRIEKLLPNIQSLNKLYRDKVKSFVSLKSAILAQELQSEAA